MKPIKISANIMEDIKTGIKNRTIIEEEEVFMIGPNSDIIILEFPNIYGCIYNDLDEDDDEEFEKEDYIKLINSKSRRFNWLTEYGNTPTNFIVTLQNVFGKIRDADTNSSSINDSFDCIFYILNSNNELLKSYYISSSIIQVFSQCSDFSFSFRIKEIMSGEGLDNIVRGILNG